MNIKEACSGTAWDYLFKTKLPIYLYGMGDGAQKIMYMLRQREIPIHGIYASDEYVRGHSFNGYHVKRLSEVKAEHGNEFISLLAFATEREPLLSHLYKLSEEMILLAPDVEVADFSGEAFDCDYLECNRTALEAVYNRLADDTSRQVFEGVINFKLSGKLSYLKEITTDRSEIYSTVLLPNASQRSNQSEFYVDVGAFRGDTMESFLNEVARANNRNGTLRLYGLEPDVKNFKKLDAFCATLKATGINADCLNAAAWSTDEILVIQGGDGGKNGSVKTTLEVLGEQAVNVATNSTALRLAQQKKSTNVRAVRLDTLFPSELSASEGGGDISFIKIDAEGAEKQVIQGAIDIIMRARPKLLVSAYHKNEDLFALPQAILSIREDYKIYLRHHPYVPAWETCFYFV